MDTEVIFDAEQLAAQVSEISKKLMDVDRNFSAAREQGVDSQAGNFIGLRHGCKNSCGQDGLRPNDFLG